MSSSIVIVIVIVVIIVVVVIVVVVIIVIVVDICDEVYNRVDGYQHKSNITAIFEVKRKLM